MNRFLLALGLVLFASLGATAQTTNELSKAEIKGRELVSKILEEIPVESFSQKGVLRIAPSGGTTTYTPFSVSTSVTNDDWEVEYVACPTNRSGTYVYGAFEDLEIIHNHGQPNEYFYSSDKGTKNPRPIIEEGFPVHELHGIQLTVPFAYSDFWICDLGLEFFHWPAQKVIKHEERKTRECTVLESTNPRPTPGSYSRVDSWIDDESLAPVHAEAYDANGKLLKIFDPKKVKKVNGQWQLEDMEIQNVQTKSRTWIKFDLSGK